MLDLEKRQHIYKAVSSMNAIHVDTVNIVYHVATDLVHRYRNPRR